MENHGAIPQLSLAAEYLLVPWEPPLVEGLDGTTTIARVVVNLEITWGWNLSFVPKVDVAILLNNGRGHDGLYAIEKVEESAAGDNGVSEGWFEWREHEGIYYRRLTVHEAWEKIPGVGIGRFENIPDVPADGQGLLLTAYAMDGMAGSGQSSSRERSYRFLPDGRFLAASAFSHVDSGPVGLTSHHFSTSAAGRWQSSMMHERFGDSDGQVVVDQSSDSSVVHLSGRYRFDEFLLVLDFDDGRSDSKHFLRVAQNSYLIDGALFV